eukprot:g16135.t1
MPLWAFDQFEVSAKGKEPDLTVDLEGVGMRRSDGAKAYVTALRKALSELSTEHVYTFCFWGISQFLDCVRWEITGGIMPGVTLDFNRLCGSPPVYLSVYELKAAGSEKRHLKFCALRALDRFRSYFRVAAWSALQPPVESPTKPAAAWQAALSLLEVMPTAGLERNYISFNATITACARARHWEVSLQLLNAMEENQIASSPATLGAAVSACERGSHWPGALHLLDEGWQKGTEHPVSSAMNACGQGQRWDLSLHLLHEAAERSVEIDGITFNCALGACARARRWEEALVLLKLGQSQKLAPDEVTHKMVNTAVLDLGVSASELLSGEDHLILSNSALDGRVYGHLPILCDEVVQALQPDTYRKPIFVDATFGRGGHSRRLLEVPEATVFALDLDPSAVSEARRLASIEPRLMPVHAAFGDLIQVLPPATELQGLLADLGVSSPQLDQKHRGFSPIEDGPLDMRMNPRKGIPASEWLDNVTPEELAWVLCSYGEDAARPMCQPSGQDRDPFLAARLAEAICAKRPLQRTIELAEVVADVKAKTVGSSPFQQPARLVFQAIRSHLNQELQELEKLLGAAFQLLMPGGRAVIVCFKGAEVAAVRSWLRQNEEIWKGSSRSRIFEVLLRWDEEKPGLNSLVGAARPLFKLPFNVLVVLLLKV